MSSLSLMGLPRFLVSDSGEAKVRHGRAKARSASSRFSPGMTNLIFVTVAAVSGKRLDAGDGAAEDQGVDVVGALIGVDGLEVLGVAHHVIFDLDAIAAVHVARHPRNIQRLAAIVA